MSNIRLAFSTNAFKKYSLEESIKKIADIGYEGAEILCDIPHAYPPTIGEKGIQSIRDILYSCNMKISNLNTFTLYAIRDVYHPSWIEDDEELRELRIQHTINCIHLAKKVGSKNVSTEPGGPIDKDVNNLHKIEKLFIKGLARTAAVAEEERIKILIEPEPNLLLETSDQFLNFIRKVGSDSVRLNFDIGHFYCVREDPAKLIYRLSDYIEHIHLADIAHNRVHNHLIPGHGSIDFKSVFNAIDEIGYRGFITVELYPYQDNPTYAAKLAYKYLTDIVI
jgi:sugar phosphate isomerase/epimerase